jgi:calcium-dependent phosphoinositide phospholipase C
MKRLLAGLLILLMFDFAHAQSNEILKLNQIQIIGSHNSYKKLPDPKVMKFLMKMRKRLGKNLDPIGLDYGHVSIDSQFTNYNMRGLEIDIYNDPIGCVFYKRRIIFFVPGVPQKSGVEALRKPGFKVLHIKDVDYQTNYYTFIDALTAIKKWSDAHPNHLPLFINIETKTTGPAEASKLLRTLGFKRCVPYDSTACDAMDAEIKSVFGNDLKNILTPDRLRGKYTSLEQMATQNGWPALDECRGKIIFIVLGGANELYTQNHPSLTGRAMCVYSKPGNPECAFVMKDNPERDSLKIQALVKQGYIVRTRSDAETVESRNNDNTRKVAAFNSGAQITSTDYYKPDLRFSNFTVQWDGIHAGRINPVTGKVQGNEWLKE